MPTEVRCRVELIPAYLDLDFCFLYTLTPLHQSLLHFIRHEFSSYIFLIHDIFELHTYYNPLTILFCCMINRLLFSPLFLFIFFTDCDRIRLREPFKNKLPFLLTAKEVSKRQMLVLHVTQDLDSKLPVR